MFNSILEWFLKWLRLFYVMIFRDIRAISVFAIFHFRMLSYKKRNKVLLHFFDETVRKFGDTKPAIIYHGQQYTFADVSNLANKISNWIESSLQLGRDEQWELFHKVSVDREQIDHKKEDSKEFQIKKRLEDHFQSTQIGLLFGNLPEVPSFIIGAARVRCSIIMFNINWRGDTLVNAFRAADCRAFIFESSYLSTLQEIASQLPDIPYFMYDKSNSQNSVEQIDFNYRGLSRNDLETGNGIEQARRFSSILNSYSKKPVHKLYPYNFYDTVSFIFTSGTTGGNMKAAPVDNIRWVGSFASQNYAFSINQKDNVYICLPLYHSLAGITALGYMFIGGATLTLADKFSASKFWQDCYENQCTAALYIGEICRYLMAQPFRPEENKHSLRIVVGPGMKKDIWADFKKRFNIKRIGEFYGSTEGNVQIFNLQDVEGSCGFIPYYYGFLCKLFFHIFLLKVDPETGELVRGPDGLCIFAKPGETGMLVGEIRSGVSFSTEFLGYTSRQESSKKIARDIKRKGDFAFVSGDLMEMDFYGNLYFKDRTGDTFRWKGENVSTTEVENIASQFLNHKDSVVYGVEVPNCDGRAGMMATNDKQIDLDKFYEFMKNHCPTYAIPKFIRITDEIQTTSTFKYIKYQLREDGINLERIKPEDQLYYFDNLTKKYQPLDHDIYESIMAGKIQIS